MSAMMGNSGFPGININGERWFPNERNFAESMKDYWGDWYCDSECGTLKAVLLHRPGPCQRHHATPSSLGTCST